MRTKMKMASKLVAMLLSAILVFAFIPQTGAQAHAGTDPGKASANTEGTVTEQDLEDLQKKVDEANAAVTAREADVKNAEAALESAKAARETPGRAFINEKAGASLSVEILTNLYKKNSALKQYATTDTYSKTLASALTPENLKKAADFVDECNELRAKHGLSPLKINYRLMCFSATSAAVSSQVIAHAVIEQFYANAFPSLKNVLFYPGENLAWGHSDPFDGWYTEEKAKFDQYVASGKYPGLKNMSLDEVYEEYPELSPEIEHYLNIIDGSYTVTGFASSTVPVGKYNNTDEQSFSEESYGESVTTDTFRSELAAYVAGAEGAVSKAETALADANAALSQAKKGRDKAVAEREEAVKRYEEQHGVCVHEWDKGTITKKPTTTAEGEMTYTCEKCKTTRTEPIAKLSKKNQHSDCQRKDHNSQIQNS